MRRMRLRNGMTSSLCLLLALGLLPWLASCGGSQIQFRYPPEQIFFSKLDGETPKIFVEMVNDFRPAKQRTGAGKVLGITFPGDDAWDRPLHLIYREALVQDMSQTQLVELVPMARQADYILSADILSLSCRLQRSPIAFLLPLAAGMGAGMAIGEDSSDRLKTGAVIGAAALMAVPLPTSFRAEAEVRLVLRDPQGEVVWERSCLGEVDESTYLTATARSDQKLVDKYLTKAVKRCNGCLIGQLRRAFLAALVESESEE
ncbi:MAG: hypothetical protein ABIF77_15100 [bacterium]